MSIEIYDKRDGLTEAVVQGDDTNNANNANHGILCDGSLTT